MKLKIIRWMGLLAGSVLSIFVAIAFIFVLGSFIDAINNGYKGSISDFIVDLIELLSMVLLIVGVVVAWFNIRVGSLLVTLMAMIFVVAFYEAEFAWLELSMLMVGLTLLFYVYYNKWLLRKGEK